MQGSWLFRNGSLEGATHQNDDNIERNGPFNGETNTRNSISSSPSPLSSCQHGSSDDLIDAGGTSNYRTVASHVLLRCRSLGPHAGLVMDNLVPRAWDAGDSESSHYVPNWRNLWCLGTAHEMEEKSQKMACSLTATLTNNVIR